MKVISNILFLLFFITVCNAQSMKVVKSNGEIIGRYTGETDTQYIVETQETFNFPKDKATIELWKASDGKGVIFLKNFGKIAAYVMPDIKSKSLGFMVYEEGMVPETYKCLGYSKGWYCLNLDGKKAYVEGKYVTWDAIDTF